MPQIAVEETYLSAFTCAVQLHVDMQTECVIRVCSVVKEEDQRDGVTFGQTTEGCDFIGKQHYWSVCQRRRSERTVDRRFCVKWCKNGTSFSET